MQCNDVDCHHDVTRPIPTGAMQCIMKVYLCTLTADLRWQSPVVARPKLIMNRQTSKAYVHRQQIYGSRHHFFAEPNVTLSRQPSRGDHRRRASIRQRTADSQESNFKIKKQVTSVQADWHATIDSEAWQQEVQGSDPCGCLQLQWAYS